MSSHIRFCIYSKKVTVNKKATLDESAVLRSAKQVSQDRRSLADLKRAMRDSPDNRQILLEVRRLESFSDCHLSHYPVLSYERFRGPTRDS